MIGTTVGNFRVVERIGDGGMGAVYRAVDEMLDREVAIKVLRSELAGNAALIERFRQEAKALARLNHPRIATLHGLEKHGNSLLMIMEYVRGDTFEALVQRSGRLSWTRAAELCAATLDALDHAHDKGVVHRDIKPANIMLAASGGVKVMDFGIARLVGKNRQTQVGHAVGTPMYMAPEQLRGEEVDGRTDLYATGAVLFELTTGRMAFEAESDYALMMKQLNEPPPLIGQFVPGVPAVIDELIACAMAKRCDDRFPSAAAFRDALLEAVAMYGVASRRSTPVPLETRLATPTPASERPTMPAAMPAAMPPAMPPAMPAATPSSTPAPAPPAPPAHMPVAETRLAEPRAVTPAETRLADMSAAHGTPHLAGQHPMHYAAHAAPAPTRVVDTNPSRWRDWRVFAAAGGLFAAAGMVVMLSRAPSGTGGNVSDSVAARAGDSALVMSASPAGGSGADASLGREDARSLIINRPAPPPPSGGGEAPPADKPGKPAPDKPAPDKPAPEKPAPAPPRAGTTGTRRDAGGTGTGAGTGATDDKNSTVPTPPPAVVPAPVKAAPPAVDEEAEAQPRIIAALEAMAAALSGRDASAASVLDGRVRDAWAELMKEGRVSLRIAGIPDVQRGAGRATAEFEGTVNVRSPFGANKRRSARFSADMERRGGRWHVTSLRPSGALELK